MEIVRRWIRMLVLGLPHGGLVTLRLECRYVQRTRYARRAREAS